MSLQILQVALVITIILAAGLFGGYGAYLMGNPKPEDMDSDKRRIHLHRSLIMGVIASFIVPIFLKLVGITTDDSSFLSKLTIDSINFEHWLVFFGFCLIAALSSQRFIGKVTDILLDRKIEEVRALLNDLEDDVQAALSKDIPNQLSDNSKLVLDSIYHHSKRRLDFNEIKKQAGLNIEDLKDALQELEDRKLVDPKSESFGNTWRVRTAGKAIVGMGNL